MPRKSQTLSVSEENSAEGGVAAVDRALSLLGAFQPGDASLSLTELSLRTRLYKSTALRLLASLEHAGMLDRQADGQYVLGNEIARLHGVYSQTTSIDRVALPVLKALTEATNESAAFHVKRGDGPQAVRLCLCRVDSNQPLRDHVRAGDILPLDRGAGARVLNAYGTAPGTAPDAASEALYATIRSLGYCALVGDRAPDLAGISAPVMRRNNSLAGAVTLTMPAHRYNPHHVPLVVDAARRLGAFL